MTNEEILAELNDIQKYKANRWREDSETIDKILDLFERIYADDAQTR